jgi:hypothetical protein
VTHLALLQKFTELAFDSSAETRWQEQAELDSFEPSVIELEIENDFNFHLFVIV